MEEIFSGIEVMSTRPDLLIVIDPVFHKTAVAEARRLGIPVVALSNTDANPDDIEHSVLGNTKARTSIVSAPGAGCRSDSRRTQRSRSQQSRRDCRRSSERSRSERSRPESRSSEELKTNKMADTEALQKLRESTGYAGLVACKKAFDEANGDIEKAIAILHEKGMAKVEKTAGRDATAAGLRLFLRAQRTRWRPFGHPRRD